MPYPQYFNVDKLYIIALIHGSRFTFKLGSSFLSIYFGPYGLPAGAGSSHIFDSGLQVILPKTWLFQFLNYFYY